MYEQSWQKTHRPFIASKRKPNIDVKDAETGRCQGLRLCRTESGLHKRRKEKKNRPQSFCDTTDSCQALYGREQGGVPRSPEQISSCCPIQVQQARHHPLASSIFLLDTLMRKGDVFGISQESRVMLSQRPPGTVCQMLCEYTTGGFHGNTRVQKLCNFVLWPEITLWPQ